MYRRTEDRISDACSAVVMGALALAFTGLVGVGIVAAWATLPPFAAVAVSAIGIPVAAALWWLPYLYARDAVRGF